MTGPSTNFFVGPQEKHYTIPKRLIYQFSGYAKAFLGGGFSEAYANAVFLPDVDPDVFQYLWQWLYTGEVNISQSGNWDWGSSRGESFTKTFRLLCRLHTLGERLLFDYRFLLFGVQHQLEELIEKVDSKEKVMMLNPKLVEEVLSESSPKVYERSIRLDMPSLRPFVLEHLCTFDLCTTVDFMDYADCFEKDGGFTAEIMIYLAGEIKWAKERWEAQVGWPVDVFRNQEQVTEDKGSSRCIASRTKLGEGVWVLLRRLCASAECSKTDIRGFSNLFEMDGQFAAEFLNHMATELLLTIERWGKEREEKVDFVAEKEEVERLEQEAENIQRIVNRNMYH